MKKYNVICLQKCTRLCLLISLPVAMLFLIVGIFGAEGLSIAEVTILVAAVAFGPLAVVWGYCLFSIAWQTYVLNLQKNEFGLQFDFENMALIAQNGVSPIFATETVIIICGRLVLHKAFVASGNAGVERHSRGNTYYFRFVAKNDRKYKVFLSDTSSVKAVRNWLND